MKKPVFLSGLLLSALTGFGQWNIAGNNNTNSSNFLGTTINEPLIVKANNIEGIRVLGSNGYVGIGNTSPD
ncbi:MAG TPA: hypothetical protein VD905_02075 [Flavobacteriales bacterium]|nr:hypothetical protein [Flavobacteriales bacterium]